MTIAVGDKLPEATLIVMGDEGPKPISSNEIFHGKKVVLFAVPGAFTPTCHLRHLPGFIEHAEDFKAKGADIVACIAVNDAFVLDAWSDVAGARGKVKMLSDGNGEFTKKIGMDFDGSGIGLGIRSKRYAMIVDDGTVTALHVEGNPGVAVESSAEKMLEEM